MAGFKDVRETRLETKIASDPDSLNAPVWLRWQAVADAVGLMFLGHPNPLVRAASYQLLKLVQSTNATWHRVSTLASGAVTSDAYIPLAAVNPALSCTL